MSQVRRYDSLLAFAEAEIGGESWSEYLDVRQVDARTALRKQLLMDDSRAPSQIPYEDAEEASRYYRRCALERQFTKILLAGSAAGEWRIEARQEDSIDMRTLDDRPLQEAQFDYEENRIGLLGVRFERVSIVSTRPRPIHDQMVDLVLAYARDNSPADKALADVRSFIQEQLECPFPVETMNKAIAAAILPRAWHTGGRRGPRTKTR